MIVVAGEFDIEQSDWDKAIPAAIEMMYASRKEDGCIQYNFYAHIDVPGRFHVYEEWASQEALDAHFASEHMAEWREKLSDIDLMRRTIGGNVDRRLHAACNLRDQLARDTAKRHAQVLVAEGEDDLACAPGPPDDGQRVRHARPVPHPGG